jgi:Family of unknown function (DUF6056)
LPRSVPRFAAAALGVALLLPLLVYASIGVYTRYAADDYCTAGVLRTQGLLGAQAWWYVGFSPRYAFSFLVSVLELFGLAIVPVLPALAMLVWWLALAWTLTRFATLLPRLGSLVVAGVLAEVVVFATLSTTPDLAQSLYWQTGMLTYLFPLVLLTLYVGWVQTRVTRVVLRGLPDSPAAGPHATKRSRVGRVGSLAVSAAVPFVAGGLSETYLAAQGLALFLALAACLVLRTPPARAARPHLAVGWLASVVALAIIQVSPTVAMREHGLQPPLGLAIQAAANTGWFFTVRFLRHALPTVLLCLAAPTLLGVEYKLDSPGALVRPLVVGAAATLVLVMGCFFPAFFAQGGDPPARSLIVPDFVLVAFFVCVGVGLAPLARRRPLALPRPALVAIATLLLALVPLAAAAQTLPEREPAARYAQRWDALDQQIRAARAAGRTDLVVPQLPRALGEPFVTTNPKDWFNQCVARYYDLDSIMADAPPPD